jgi:uncharacterized protein (DUF697 family)
MQTKAEPAALVWSRCVQKTLGKFNALTNLWDNVREADLRPYRVQAQRGVQIAIIGRLGSGRSTLADRMRRDPSHPQHASDTPVAVLDLDMIPQAGHPDLTILVIDSRRQDIAAEQELIRNWQNSGKRALVLINLFEDAAMSEAVKTMTGGGSRWIVSGSVLDGRFLTEKFSQAVIEIMPDQLLALGRYFPLFRIPIAHHLINDTSFSNAAYAMSTGLVETIGVLDIPITIADTVVLTKAQAFLVYKLGLALGYSTNFQDYIAEFGSVLGGGFVWRQLARSLVGLIPLWGIIPKTGVSYAGTYVVGHAVLQWYLTGKHISKNQMQQIYSQALEKSKAALSKLPIPRLQMPRLQMPKSKKSKSEKLLPAPKPEKTTRRKQKCPSCGKTSARDARFCQYCGATFETGKEIGSG